MATPLSDRQVGNLPAEVTSFVGRRREVAEVKRLLSVARLVTLTGMGGVGKTRLALRAAGTLRMQYPGGVWLVELAGLTDAELLAQTVATGLGLEDPSTVWSITSLSDRLARRRLLIVLDNCEHLLDPCAALSHALLRSCPELRILTTTRQPLSIPGEHILAITPLSVPAPDHQLSPESLVQFDAINLFQDRASAVCPEFNVDAANQAAVAGICRRLDGIPLALELVARRLRAQSPSQLLNQLEDRYALLTTAGSRVGLDRHQTLQALIDWSFELCTPREQLLWGRLSVFVGGYDIESAMDVCSGGEISREIVEDLVSSMVDKSVVTVQENDGLKHRYQLPETLREYGQDRLAEYGQTRELRQRHRDYYERLATFTESAWFGSDQVELFMRVRLEHANLRAALNFCLAEAGEAEQGLVIASALRFYWVTAGRLTEARHWLNQLLDHENVSSAVRLKGLYVSGYFATMLNDFSAVDELLGEARQFAHRTDDPLAAAYIAQISGLARLFQRQPSAAVRFLEQALWGHRQLEDHAGMAYDQAMLALALTALGDHGRATQRFEQCLALTDSAGERWVRSFAFWAIGVQACRSGNYVRAAAAERQSIRLRLPFESRFLVGANVSVLAWIATADGETVRAARLFGAAQAIMEASGTSLTSRNPAAQLHEQYIAMAREAMGDAAFDDAFEYGAHLRFRQMVTYALRESVDPQRGSIAAAQSTEGLESLTRREHQIADLVSKGLSNKEIARRLVISQRTAEGHVEHILAKLGFTNRGQIAAYVHERHNQLP